MESTAHRTVSSSSSSSSFFAESPLSRAVSEKEEEASEVGRFFVVVVVLLLVVSPPAPPSGGEEKVEVIDSNAEPSFEHKERYKEALRERSTAGGERRAAESALPTEEDESTSTASIGSGMAKNDGGAAGVDSVRIRVKKNGDDPHHRHEEEEEEGLDFSVLASLVVLRWASCCMAARIFAASW